MRTECTDGQFEFKGLWRRKVQAAFSGKAIAPSRHRFVPKH
jgi:hypothetical protein